MNVRPDNTLQRYHAALLGLAMVFTTSLVIAEENLPANSTAENNQPASGRSARQQETKSDQFKLSARELSAIVLKYRPYIGDKELANFEGVVVTRPTELLPVRSPTREVWGGLAAPFWAFAHPTQAWRILMPIPAE